MRGYSVAAVALALDVDAKWLDNLLSQHRVPGVNQARQGVQRRIQPEGLYRIATVHALNREFQIPVARALRLAQALWAESGDQGGESATFAQGDLAVSVNRDQLRQRIEAALAEALEIAPRTRRGRPPKPRR